MASDNTEARRQRMRSLWLLNDRQIAERLIEEGYGGAVPRTAEGKRKQVASMQRNVWNDRKWWRETEWRKEKLITAADANETRGEYIAVLDSLREIGVEILMNPKEKGTPRTQALVALTRIEEAKAKATGVAQIEQLEPENAGDRPLAMGVVLGVRAISPEMKQELREQGYDIDDDDGDGGEGGASPAP